MVVIIRFEVNDAIREAVSHHHGKKGLATRKDVENAFRAAVAGFLEDTVDEMDMETAWDNREGGNRVY